MRLDTAKDEFAKERGAENVLIKVSYHPFMIDPATKAEGEPYMEYNRRRWGSDGWTRSMKTMGKKEGAPYAKWVTWPNTTHCSRLLMLAEKHGLGDKVVGILYRYCYEEGLNVSLREVVARAAVEAGVPDGEAYIHSDRGLLELSQLLRRNASGIGGGKRISSAPTFNVRVGRASTSFSGAQDAETWLSILEQCADVALSQVPTNRPPPIS